MELGAAGTESFSWDVQRLAAYFYAEDGIIPLTWAERTQRYFDELVEMFNGVVLHENLDNMVIMDCQPCHALGVHSVEAYVPWMAGEGQNYW